MIPAMGRDRGEQATPDLFSTEMVRDGTSSPIGPIPATQPTADASSQRHVLPKNLRTAVKHLSDGELDLLHAATLEEMGRRGRLPSTDQTTHRSSRRDKSSFGRQVEAATVSLTRGQINAVRAAFKAGIKPAHCATVRHIPIRRAQGAGVQRRWVEQNARRGQESQSHLHRTASGRPKAIRLQRIPPRFISTFTVSISMVWTDGCRNYKRDGGCSNIGSGCLLKEVTCLQHPPLKKNDR
jgi:hypothetical protein